MKLLAEYFNHSRATKVGMKAQFDLSICTSKPYFRFFKFIYYIFYFNYIITLFFIQIEYNNNTSKLCSFQTFFYARIFQKNKQFYLTYNMAKNVLFKNNNERQSKTSYSTISFNFRKIFSGNFSKYCHLQLQNFHLLLLSTSAIFCIDFQFLKRSVDLLFCE